MTTRRRIRHSDLDGLDRGRLDHLKADIINQGFPGGTASESVTFDNTVNGVALPTGAYAEGTRVIFSTDGTLPAELSAGTFYHVREIGSTGDYTLHPTAADAVADTNGVAITDDGTGTHTAWLV